jgi:hypothetical protein
LEREAVRQKPVAHYNRAKGTFSIGLIFRDLHRAIDLIVDLFLRYREMIIGVSMSRSAGVYPWITIFREAWIPDDAHLQRVLTLIYQVQGKRERGEVLSDDE